jgi:glycine/D-amino acid oxidase-like deaminating enzyme
MGRVGQMPLFERGTSVKYDCVIIGAGIQGLVLLDQALAHGLNACCIDRLPRVGDGQTLRSQFYIHRGHFYTGRSLIDQLHDAYPKWRDLVRRLRVQVRSTESYVGFVGDSGAWTRMWTLCDLHYVPVSRCPPVLEGNRLAHLYRFSHMMFDGRELLAKLVQRNRGCLKFGTIDAIDESQSGYRLRIRDSVLDTHQIVLCAGAGTPEVIGMLPRVRKDVPLQTRACQVLAMRGCVPDASIVIPDAQMFIAPQYETDGTPMLLYTHGTDPVLEGGKRAAVDPTRLHAQLNALKSVLPGLHAVVSERTLYLAQKTESAEFGAGTCASGPYVERIADGVVCVLPNRLSLAINAAETALVMIEPEQVPLHAEPLVGVRTHLLRAAAEMRFMSEVNHA